MSETEDILQQFQLSPDDQAKVAPRLDKFLEIHLKDKRKLVLITSGGTTVPLEQHTVRFIDNFSAGNRGAASAEYFLRSDYAVIFLYRHNSVVPFDRHFRKGNNIFGLMKLSDSGQSVEVDQSKMPSAVQVMKEYSEIEKEQTLLYIDFITLHEYVSLLRFICQRLKPFGKRALVYLAAAVSDFFIPANELPVHKIQSSDGPLNLQLKLTPKMLQPFVVNVIPEAYIVSFKLETNPDILDAKSKDALQKYHHQLVIGNILDRRKVEVIFVTPKSNEAIVLSPKEQETGKIEIEEKIVKRLSQLHEEYYSKSDNDAEKRKLGQED